VSGDTGIPTFVAPASLLWLLLLDTGYQHQPTTTTVTIATIT
jgi:hypothetical protein